MIVFQKTSFDLKTRYEQSKVWTLDGSARARSDLVDKSLKDLHSTIDTNIHGVLQPMKDLGAALEAKEKQIRTDLDRLTKAVTTRDDNMLGKLKEHVNLLRSDLSKMDAKVEEIDLQNKNRDARSKQNLHHEVSSLQKSLKKILPPINYAFVLQSEFGPIKTEHEKLWRLRKGYSS